MDILNRTDPETLNKASLGPVSYAQLFRQPNQYRGRLVTVSGVVRRANRLELLPERVRNQRVLSNLALAVG